MRDPELPVSERRRVGAAGNERGAALVEFAIAIPIFLALIALIFDAGVGFSASRESSSAARSAARVAALGGEDRLADFHALRAIKATYGDGSAGGDTVQQVTIYLSEPTGDGSVPAGCGYDASTGSAGSSVPGKCNVYRGSDLASLSQAQFSTATVAGVDVCNPGAPDAAWCPLGRRAAEGKNLGVAVWTTHEATVGLGASRFELNDRAVFALYFQPLPAAAPTP